MWGGAGGEEGEKGRAIMTSGSSWYFMMAMGFCWLSMMACMTLGFWNAAARSGSAMMRLMTCRRPPAGHPGAVHTVTGRCSKLSKLSLRMQ